MNKLLSLTLLLFICSCSPHSVRPFDELQIDAPSSYPSSFAVVDGVDIEKKPWWMQFEDKQLNSLMDKAFSDNYSLKAAWYRLGQAKALASIATSARYPTLDASGGLRRIRAKDLQATATQIGTPGGALYQTTYFQRNGLSFELDIWRRAASASNAEIKRAEASKLDYENTALLLSSTVAETWFTYLEQLALYDLIGKQVKTDEILLELTQLRFSIGQGTALSVFQQRQQLSSTEAQLPLVKAQLVRSANMLSTLLGQTSVFDLEGTLPKLPNFPSSMSPLDALNNRPDLLASQRRLQGAEFDLASTFAERFPTLRVGLSYDFSATNFSEVFERQLGSVFGDLALPVIDGGRRRAAVRQSESRVNELLESYRSEILTSFWEIDSAISTEKYQKELIEKLEKQLVDTRANFKESRSRYFNGQSDFLDVTIAQQSVQTLERRLVSENKALLLARVQLSIALGGAIVESKEEDLPK